MSERWGLGDGLLSHAWLKRPRDNRDASSVEIDVAPEPLPNTVTWNSNIDKKHCPTRKYTSKRYADDYVYLMESNKINIAWYKYSRFNVPLDTL